MNGYCYAGFGIRAGAALIDTAIILVMTIPFLLWWYDATLLNYFNSSAHSFPGPMSFFVSTVFPAIATILFWRFYHGSPGKLVLNLCVVDSVTLGPPSIQQSIIRYCGYFFSGMLLLSGFLWVIFDKRKQGFHDKLANTLVIRKSGNTRTEQASCS